MEWYLTVIDAIECNVCREPPIEHIMKPPGNICKVYFSYKFPEIFNLLSILNSTESVYLLKYLHVNFVTPNSVHNIRQPISHF